MNDRYLFKAKTKAKENPMHAFNNAWVKGNLINSGGKYYIHPIVNVVTVNGELGKIIVMHEVDPSTICQCTGLKDKAGTLIWENDILMCNNNPKDLVKAVFGEFAVIDVDTLEAIDGVVGWHYEVIPTDEISKCKPFCLPMPLTDIYINRCDMKVCGSIFDYWRWSDEPQEIIKRGTHEHL